jgi:hypothetical protein
MSAMADKHASRYGLPVAALEAIEYDNSLARVAEVMASVRDGAVAELRAEVERLARMTTRCGICGERGKPIKMHGPHPVRSQRNEFGSQGDWSPVPWCEDCANNRLTA